MKTLKRAIILCISITSSLFISCQKELNFDPISSVAVFTFDATAGNCNNVSLNGFYLTGFAMTATNTVTINVNVTSPGTFTLNTSSVNGISFSASGAFANTGAQTITLTATGTPAAAGNFVYDFPGVTNGCAFEIDFANPGNAAFTFNGVGGVCTDYVVSGDYWITVALNSNHSVKLNVNVSIPGAYNISTVENGVTFSGTGNFTSTGDQTVLLTASGTITNYIYTTYLVSEGTSSCTFDVDYEPAIFSLNKNGTDCLTPVFTGTYTAGSPLTAANTLELKVDVTKTGAYSFWTTAVNDITFEKIGTFTTTGPQSVILNGTGTPLAAGNFLIEIGTHPAQACDIQVTVN